MDGLMLCVPHRRQTVHVHCLYRGVTTIEHHPQIDIYLETINIRLSVASCVSFPAPRGLINKTNTELFSVPSFVLYLYSVVIAEALTRYNFHVDTALVPNGQMGDKLPLRLPHPPRHPHQQHSVACVLGLSGLCCSWARIYLFGINDIDEQL